jgi:hypothetical protein
VKDYLGLKTLAHAMSLVNVVRSSLDILAILLKLRITEHHQHICPYYPDKLAVAEYSISLRHSIYSGTPDHGLHLWGGCRDQGASMT